MLRSYSFKSQADNVVQQRSNANSATRTITHTTHEQRTTKDSNCTTSCRNAPAQLHNNTISTPDASPNPIARILLESLARLHCGSWSTHVPRSFAQQSCDTHTQTPILVFGLPLKPPLADAKFAKTQCLLATYHPQKHNENRTRACMRSLHVMTVWYKTSHKL